MNVNDVVLQARQDFLNDNFADYLWSDPQLNRFIHEAVIEACKRAPLIQGIFNISVIPTQSTYTLDSSIRQIYMAKLALNDNPLIMSTDIQLTMGVSTGWRNANGTPSTYIRKGHTLTLYPNPILADTLTLTANVIPVSPSDYDFEYDIDPAYQRSIVYYVVYKCFMVRDQDTYNPVKAAEFLVMFNDRFGVQKDAQHDLISQDSPMYGVAIGGRMC